MPEPITAVLERLAGQPERFDELRALLADAALREELLDHADDVTRGTSARFAAKELERTKFYAELVQREGKRLRGEEQLDALTIINEQFPRIVEAVDHAMSLDDASHLAKFASHIAFPLLLKGKLELGVTVFKRLLDQAENTGNRSLEIMAGTRYADFLARVGRLDQAFEAFSGTLQLAELDGSHEALTEVLFGLGHVAILMGKYEESTEFCQQSLEHARNLLDKTQISKALGTLGSVAAFQRRLDDARRYLAESLEIKREIGNFYGLAGDLHNLAIAVAWQGDYPEGQRLFLEALSLNRRIGNRPWEANNLTGLASIALDQGRFEEARQLYSSAQSIAVDIGNELLIAACEFHLGAVAAALESNVEARLHFERGIQLSRKLGTKAWLAAGIDHLGALYTNLGDYQAAEPLLSEALTISKEIGDTNLSASATTNLGSIAIAMEKLPEATEYLDQALQLAAKAGMPRGILISLHQVVRLLLKANKNSSAALLAYGVSLNVQRLELVLRAKMHQDLARAVDKGRSVLTAEVMYQLEQQATTFSIKELADYALQALRDLQRELAGVPPKPAPAEQPVGDLIAETAEHDAGRDAHA